jgi:hypothetical protein
MERPKPRLSENKLLMLYAVDKLGCITNNQALQFFIENDFMDYIDVQLSLAELTDGKLLHAVSQPAGLTYYVTELGLDAIDFFKNKVPVSRRSAVDCQAEKWRDIFMLESHVFADYTTAINGDIVVRLAARENDMLLFEMSISVPSSKEAEIMCDNWKKNSSQVYAAVLSMLSG